MSPEASIVEQPHALAEAFDGERLDTGFVELVLVDEFQDEPLLLVRAFPALVLGGVRRVGGLREGSAGGRLVVHPVVTGRDETGVEDLLVDVGLEELIDALGRAGDVVGGHQLGLDRVARAPDRRSLPDRAWPAR